MTIASLDQFLPHPDLRISVHPQHRSFAYSDGDDNERRVLAILKSVSDLSTGSKELANCIDDWVTEYHFSGTRANLLRHIALRPYHKVLELGAGCGSITRFLGETGAAITAVEGSMARAQCASTRCRDLGNVNVYCSNFQDIEFESKYDVVTLIGVMEYSPKFFESDDPIGACLAVARKALRPGGTLLLAIENQLGFKYFAGATEDHLGDHYAGVEGRYPPRNVVTFGQKQLRGHLLRAGFSGIEFQYPFPDYKVPTVILFESGLTHDGFVADELIRHLDERDYSGRHKREIDSTLVWPQLGANGLIGEFANSFLVVARSPGADAIDASDADCLALTYATGRSAPFQTVTRFLATSAGSINVSKTRLYQSLPTPEGPLSHSVLSDSYQCGRTLHSGIYHHLSTGDSEGLRNCLRRWLDFLQQFTVSDGADDGGVLIQGRAFDCLPTNLVVVGDQLIYIDQEWSVDRPLQLSTIVLRYLFNLAFTPPSGAVFIGKLGPEPIKSIKRLAADVGVVLDSTSVREFFELNEAVNAQVFRGKASLPEHLIHQFDDLQPHLPTNSTSESDPLNLNDSLKRIVRKILG